MKLHTRNLRRKKWIYKIGNMCIFSLSAATLSALSYISKAVSIFPCLSVLRTVSFKHNFLLQFHIILMNMYQTCFHISLFYCSFNKRRIRFGITKMKCSASSFNIANFLSKSCIENMHLWNILRRTLSEKIYNHKTNHNALFRNIFKLKRNLFQFI